MILASSINLLIATVPRKYAVCPRSKSPILCTNYCIKWVTASWTYSKSGYKHNCQGSRNRINGYRWYTWSHIIYIIWTDKHTDWFRINCIFKFLLILSSVTSLFFYARKKREKKSAKFSTRLKWLKLISSLGLLSS